MTTTEIERTTEPTNYNLVQTKINLHTRANGPADVATSARSGELIKTASITGAQAVLVFHKKYGAPKEIGYRTVVLHDEGDEYVVVMETFIPTPDPELEPELDPTTTPAPRRPIGPQLNDILTYEVWLDGELFATCEKRENAIWIGQEWNTAVYEKTRGGRSTLIFNEHGEVE